MSTRLLQQEQGYRETELGLLPKNWEVKKLGDVTHLVMGQSPPGETYNTEGKGMPFLQGKAEFGAIYPTHIKHTTKPLKIARKGSVLLSIRAPVGDVNIADIDYCIGRGLASLSKENNQFLFYLLMYFRPSIEKEGTGSTFKAINKPKLKNISVTIPPMPEQENIAYVLATIKSAIGKTENIISSLRELKKSLMKHLFTYGAVSFEGTDKVKLKETEIGSIPEGWEVKRIGHITETYSGGTPNRGKKEYWNGDIPWAKSGELNDSRIYKVEEKISQEGLENSSAKYVSNNDLLIAMYGATAGKVGIAKSRFTINQAICAIKPNQNFISEFYFYYLIFIRDKILRQRYGGAQPNLNQQIIKNLEIPVPMITEQEKIASILSSVDEKIKAEKGRNETLSELFKSMLSNLMSAKIRLKDSNLVA